MQADVFSVIADPTRRRIVRLLADETHTVGAVVEKLGVSQPTISKHLKVLREAGVVSAVVEGQRRLYSLNPQVLTNITDWVEEVLRAYYTKSGSAVSNDLPGNEMLDSTFPESSVDVGGFAESHQQEFIEAKDVSESNKPRGAEPSSDTASERFTGPDNRSETTTHDVTGEKTTLGVGGAADESPNAFEAGLPVRTVPNSKLVAEPVADTVAAQEQETDEDPVVEKPEDGSAYTSAEEVSEGVIPLRPFTPSNFSTDSGAGASFPKQEVAEPIIGLEEPAATTPVEASNSGSETAITVLNTELENDGSVGRRAARREAAQSEPLESITAVRELDEQHIPAEESSEKAAGRLPAQDYPTTVLNTPNPPLAHESELIQGEAKESEKISRIPATATHNVWTPENPVTSQSSELQESGYQQLPQPIPKQLDSRHDSKGLLARMFDRLR